MNNPKTFYETPEASTAVSRSADAASRRVTAPATSVRPPARRHPLTGKYPPALTSQISSGHAVPANCCPRPMLVIYIEEVTIAEAVTEGYAIPPANGISAADYPGAQGFPKDLVMKTIRKKSTPVLVSPSPTRRRTKGLIKNRKTAL